MRIETMHRGARPNKPIGRRAKDLTGQKFGKLTARRIVGKDHRGSIIWECTCDCGQTKWALSANLTAGRIESCGCLRRKVVEANGERSALATNAAVRLTAAQTAYIQLLAQTQGKSKSAVLRGLIDAALAAEPSTRL